MDPDPLGTVPMPRNWLEGMKSDWSTCQVLKNSLLSVNIKASNDYTYIKSAKEESIDTTKKIEEWGEKELSEMRLWLIVIKPYLVLGLLFAQHYITPNWLLHRKFTTPWSILVPLLLTKTFFTTRWTIIPTLNLNGIN